MVYGVEETMEALQLGLVETVICDRGLKTERYEITSAQCESTVLQFVEDERQVQVSMILCKCYRSRHICIC